MRNKILFSMVLVLAALNNACSLVEAVTHRQALSDYAEALFRRQNELTTVIMMLPEENDAVYQAEMDMHTACKLLNDYARLTMEGKNASILFQRKVKNSLPACDVAIQKLETILDVQ